MLKYSKYISAKLVTNFFSELTDKLKLLIIKSQTGKGKIRTINKIIIKYINDITMLLTHQTSIYVSIKILRNSVITSSVKNRIEIKIQMILI